VYKNIIFMALIVPSLLGFGLCTAHAQTASVQELKDPTKPKNFNVKTLVNAATNAITPIKITAIFASPKQHYTVIDGESLQVGDKVRDYVVHAINSQHVVLARMEGGKKKLTTLSVFEEEVKSYAKQ
jgi:hypothetical protein